MTNLNTSKLEKCSSYASIMAHGVENTKLAYETYSNRTSEFGMSESFVPYIDVRHHENIIARFFKDGTIAVSNAGYNSRTTSHRLDVIVNEATNGRIRVGIRQGEMRFLDGDTLKPLGHVSSQFHAIAGPSTVDAFGWVESI